MYQPLNRNLLLTQELELGKSSERQNWAVQEVYTDVISGAKSKRPALDKLMKAVMRREVDIENWLFNFLIEPSSAADCNLGPSSNRF